MVRRSSKVRCVRRTLIGGSEAFITTQIVRIINNRMATSLLSCSTLALLSDSKFCGQGVYLYIQSVKQCLVIPNTPIRLRQNWGFPNIRSSHVFASISLCYWNVFIHVLLFLKTFYKQIRKGTCSQ